MFVYVNQCARRWFDESDTGHLVNLGKYVSAMLAAGAKVAYEKDRSLGSLSLLVIVSSSATMYQLYWDFVKDWGLLQPNSKNPWLRNDLILKSKSIYYLSMVCMFVSLSPFRQVYKHSQNEFICSSSVQAARSNTHCPIDKPDSQSLNHRSSIMLNRYPTYYLNHTIVLKWKRNLI
jgi:hypothetical protein